MNSVTILENQFELAEYVYSVFEKNIDKYKSASTEQEKAILLGKFFEAGGMQEQAYKAYNLAIGSELDAEAKARLALTSLKSGNIELGSKYAIGALDANPELTFETLAGYKSSVKTVAGDVKKLKGDFSSALEDYSEALNLVPEDPHAAGGAATCLVNLGRFEDAVNLKEKLTHPTYRGLKATLELYQNDGQGPSISALELSAAAVNEVAS